eukprot:875222-Prorocentrum_minimum.AAC.1
MDQLDTRSPPRACCPASTGARTCQSDTGSAVWSRHPPVGLQEVALEPFEGLAGHPPPAEGGEGEHAEGGGDGVLAPNHSLNVRVHAIQPVPVSPSQSASQPVSRASQVGCVMLPHQCRARAATEGSQKGSESARGGREGGREGV